MSDKVQEIVDKLKDKIKNGYLRLWELQTALEDIEQELSKDKEQIETLQAYLKVSQKALKETMAELAEANGMLDWIDEKAKEINLVSAMNNLMHYFVNLHPFNKPDNIRDLITKAREN